MLPRVRTHDRYALEVVKSPLLTRLPLPARVCFQKKEIAYIEHVLKLKIHHKLDIEQFRNKLYEKAEVGCATAIHAPTVHVCYVIA